MKKLLPLVMLILGLGAGVGAGMVLKPKPPEKTAACAAPAAGHVAEAAPAATGQGAAAAPCPEDPFTPEPEHAAEDAAAVYVALDKPFVVPVFSGDKTVAMVVVSLSVATKSDGAQVLADGDRVEIYRPLIIDPKEARRARAEKAKAKRRAG